MTVRRLVIAFSLLALAFASSPAPAAAGDGAAACEGYCVTVAGGCFVLVGWVVGKEKCEAMYRGCLDGCKAAVEE